MASQRGTKTSVGSHARWEFPGPQTGFGPKGVLLLDVNWRHCNSAQFSSQAGPGPRPTMYWPMGWMAAARSKGLRGLPYCNPVETSRVKERNRNQSGYLTIPGKTGQIKKLGRDFRQGNFMAYTSKDILKINFHQNLLGRGAIPLHSGSIRIHNLFFPPIDSNTNLRRPEIVTSLSLYRSHHQIVQQLTDNGGRGHALGNQADHSSKLYQKSVGKSISAGKARKERASNSGTISATKKRSYQGVKGGGKLWGCKASRLAVNFKVEGVQTFRLQGNIYVLIKAFSAQIFGQISPFLCG